MHTRKPQMPIKYISLNIRAASVRAFIQNPLANHLPVGWIMLEVSIFKMYCKHNLLKKYLGQVQTDTKDVFYS